jgi:hypothetical protein
MMSSSEDPTRPQPTATAGNPAQPQRSRKAKVLTRSTPRTKAPKAASARKGSKTDKILALLKRPGSVASKEMIMVTVGWRTACADSSAGRWARRWAGVESTKREDGDRVYKITR